MINHHIPYILTLLLLLFSCTQKEKNIQNENESVLQLQERAQISSLESSYQFLKKAERLIKIYKNTADSLQTENAYLLGEYFTEKGILDSAAIYYQKAVDIVPLPYSYNKGAKYFFSAHEAFRRLGKNGDGIALAQRYLDNQTETDYKEKALGFLILTQAYSHIGNKKKAFYFNENQIKMLRLANDIDFLNGALIEKANLLYFLKKNTKQTFQLLDSLISFESNLNNHDKTVLYTNYGVYQFYEGNYSISNKYYQKALYFKKKIEINAEKNTILTSTYANLAEVSIELQDYKKARAYLDTIKNIGIHNIPRYLRKSVLRYEMRLANQTNQDLSKVFQLQDTLTKYQDLTYREKTQTELVELKRSNENEKQILQEKLETELKNSQLQSTLLWGTIVTAIILVFGLLFYFRRKINFERSSLQMQQRLLRSQMKPHFTFNTLSAIQHQIKKNPETGTNYLLKFSRLLRLFLENSMDDYVLFEKEIESLRKYMDFQALQRSDPFQYQFSYINMTEDDFIFIPPMLLQPFIENSIEHGFSNIKYQGIITIIFEMKNKLIFCTIEDNGKGLTNKNANSFKQSASVQLISNFLKKSTKQDLIFENKKDKNNNENGIRVQFFIPYKLTEND